MSKLRPREFSDKKWYNCIVDSISRLAFLGLVHCHVVLDKVTGENIWNAPVFFECGHCLVSDTLRYN